MPQSLAQIYIHLVFSTKNREPLIKSEDLQRLHAYMGGILNNIQCDTIRVGGIQDHVHLLFRLNKSANISEVVRTVKANSSRFLKSLGEGYNLFAWQDGYGAFSVSKSQLDNAIHYIAKQEEHHKQRNFKEEFVEFLKIYDVDYNEKYLWD